MAEVQTKNGISEYIYYTQLLKPYKLEYFFMFASSNYCILYDCFWWTV
jgi:hypothetical protein